MPSKTNSTIIGKIVEWDYQKGYGYLKVGNSKVFLHRHDILTSKRPEIGDLIHFSIGEDSQGRACAKHASRHGLAPREETEKRWRVSPFAVVALVCLMVPPGVALLQYGANPLGTLGYAVGISLFSYWRYWQDKDRAGANQWRISEAELHFTELLGGWPGAFIAQRQLRHKCLKTSYLIVFWLIIGLHQYLAVDSLLNWRFSRKALEFLNNTVERSGR